MDGSCFFHTLSLGINGDFSHSHLYRRSICNKLFYDYNIWEDMLKVLHCNSMSPQMYWDTMVAGNHWATSAAISAATNTMHCNLNMWTYGVKNYQEKYYNEYYIHSMDINTLNILLKNNHFQLQCDYNDNISANVGTEIIIQSDNKVIKRKDVGTKIIIQSDRKVIKRKASDIYEKMLCPLQNVKIQMWRINQIAKVPLIM